MSKHKPFIEGYIYAVLCLTTGDRYVGQSTRMHMIKTYHGKFGNNLGKVKQKLFKKDILENHITEQSELNRLEQKHIAEYRERYGLEVMWRNNADGGCGNPGIKRSQETCKKNSESNRGRKFDKVHLKNHNNSKLGKLFTKERCKNISLARNVKCLIDKIQYDSYGIASSTLKLSYSTIKHRIKSDKFPTYIKLGNNNTLKLSQK